MNVSYVHPGNQSVKWFELNAQSYQFERDLEDKMIPVTARLADPLCGGVDFSSTEWTGPIKGASTKVRKYLTELSGKSL